VFATRDVDGARCAAALSHSNGVQRDGSRTRLARSSRAGYRPFYSDIHAIGR
jgi:hypothetical protein